MGETDYDGKTRSLRLPAFYIFWSKIKQTK